MMCPKHESEIKVQTGQSCGAAGWGPGHRIPAGYTVALMDESIEMIKKWCRDGRNCGDKPLPAKCHSRDPHDDTVS